MTRTLGGHFGRGAAGALVVLLLTCGSAVAQTGAGLMLEPWKDGQRLEFSFDTRYFNQVSTTGVAGSSDVWEHESEARWRLDPEKAGSLSIGHEISYFDWQRNAPDLVDESVAAGMRVYQDETWAVDVVAGVGIAGHPVYEHDEAIYFMGDTIATMNLDEKSSLLFFLNYNGNRSVWPDVPLPGIAYQRRSSETLSYMVGVPRSSIHWQPMEQVKVGVAYTLPLTFDLSADWEFVERWHLFGMFENRFWAFQVQEINYQRLMLEQKRVETGLKWDICEHATLVLAGGYAFDMRQTTGFDVFSDRNEVWSSDEFYGRAGFEVGF